MGEFARKADGRRIFTVEFKRGIVQQLVKGEKTLAEVSRELDIQPSVIRGVEAVPSASCPLPPAYSPESNGLAEAFVHTFKRDYILGRPSSATPRPYSPTSVAGSTTTTARRPIRRSACERPRRIGRA